MDNNLALLSDPASRLDRVIASVLLNMDRGEDFDLERLIPRYPDLEDELREFFNDMQFASQAASLLKELRPDDSATRALANDGSETPAPLLIPGFHVEGIHAYGGMGVVYRAVQISLGRRVALKVLTPKSKSDPQRLRRFKEEAKLAASLHLSNVLVVHDILEIDGSPVLVMPLVEGCDLRTIIAARRQQPVEGEHPVCTEWRTLSREKYLERMLVLLDKVIEATVGLHIAGVLHRDIKPSNILIDGSGNPWLADFGLAELLNIGIPTGEAMGTLGYMSPEQSSGTKIDVRGDIFALGVTIYEALTLRRPYGKQTITERHGRPSPPSRIERSLSRDFDPVVLKSLHPIREQRYDSVRELSSDWQRVRQGILPYAATPSPFKLHVRWLSKNRPLVATLVLAVFGMLATWWTTSPGDGTLSVVVPTSISCVEGAMAPLDELSGAPDESHVILPASTGHSLTFRNVPPGEYLVVVSDAAGNFHEVYRKVPTKDDKVGLFKHQQWRWSGRRTVELPTIEVPAQPEKNMCRFEGAKGFQMGTAHFDEPASPPYQTDIEAFYLDTQEVTVGEYCKVFPVAKTKMTPQTPAKTGMTGVTYDESLAYLESVGKRPMSEAEYEFAATNGGTTSFPWGNDAAIITDWRFAGVGEPPFDRTATNPAVLGLYSNVAEWTSSRMVTPPLRLFMAHQPEMLDDCLDCQVARGGPYSVVLGMPCEQEWRLGPRHRHMLVRNVGHPGLGIRCARSVHPRLLQDPEPQRN